MVGLFQLSAEAVLILTSGGQTIYGFVFYRRARRIDAEVKAIDQAPPKAMSVGAGEDGVVAEGPRSELSSYGWSLSDRRSLTLPYSASIQYSTSVHYSSSLGSSFEQPPPRYDEGDMAIRLEMIR
ncbi:uncharacterized protein RCC_07333 [Ramularia collo-cygni]|uniref:Uncharacterized protein n=1 Tax=Ramularia collo-cygni TaxID=112498 RepID=A0A2D3V7Q6_9PEZI|nr:uncharacterized protein RCC_07333 [Ramularia collo-cygni]CZT21470.1 uncharacterized protein RCC_07333 [Ramularia collo-cygni]